MVPANKDEPLATARPSIRKSVTATCHGSQVDAVAGGGGEGEGVCNQPAREAGPSACKEGGPSATAPHRLSSTSMESTELRGRLPAR